MVNSRGARVMFDKCWGDRSASPTAVVRQLGWSDLTEQWRKTRLVMTYKIEHGHVGFPSDRCAPPGRLTWHNHNKKIIITRSTHDTPKKSFFGKLHSTGMPSVRTLLASALVLLCPSHLRLCALGQYASILF